MTFVDMCLVHLRDRAGLDCGCCGSCGHCAAYEPSEHFTAVEVETAAGTLESMAEEYCRAGSLRALVFVAAMVAS